MNRLRLLLKQHLENPHDVRDMLNQQCRSSYDERLDKLEKKVSALSALLIGYLAGHFLGLLLF